LLVVKLVFLAFILRGFVHNLDRFLAIPSSVYYLVFSSPAVVQSVVGVVLIRLCYSWLWNAWFGWYQI